MTSNTEAAILERIIEPQANGLSPDLARQILLLTFTSVDHQRIETLSDKAQQGSLTQDEEEELDNYIRLDHLLALLKSKARLALKHSQALA